MDISQGKIPRYAILTIGAYAALYFLAASPQRNAVQAPQDNKNIERKVEPQDTPSNIQELEKKLNEKGGQKPGKPPDKYGPEWQEKMRKEGYVLIV